MAGNPAFIFMNPTIKIGTDSATATDMVCEVTKVELTNDVNMVDTGSLCGPAQQPGKISWTLEVEGYQDYSDGSLWRFLWDNSRKQAQFELIPKDTDLTPAGAANPTISGTIVCVPGTVGGTREEVAGYSVSLPLVGDPVLDDGVAVQAASTSSAAAY